MDERTAILVNNIVEVGIAAIAIIGTVVGYFVVWKGRRPEDQEAERNKLKEKARTIASEPMEFITPIGQKMDTHGVERLHAREWHTWD